jgi:hypothetical protein
MSFAIWIYNMLLRMNNFGIENFYLRELYEYMWLKIVVSCVFKRSRNEENIDLEREQSR